MRDYGKVSVIMGVYNCEKTLPSAIDSIIHQTYDNIELIICDDCSKDETFLVAKQYQKKYPNKIILIQNETNSYLAYSLNHCLKYVTGRYVARMDGDDLCEVNRIEKQIEFLENNKEYCLCGTAMQRFYDDGSYGAIDYREEYPTKFTMAKGTGTPFNHATIVTYKEIYDKLGGYTVLPRTIRGQDRDLWYRFFSKELKGYNLKEPLYLVREDVEAIKRRTVKDRYMTLQTDFFGYSLLSYPWYWYYKPIINFMKILVPQKIVLLLRKIQARIQKQ